MPAALIVQNSVAFDASTMRPATVRVPRSSSSSASLSPPGRSCSGMSLAPAAARSGTAGPVAVLPRADVPGGVERQPAVRARRAAGGNEAERALRERAGRARGDPYAEDTGPVDGDVVRQRLNGGVAILLRLDDYLVALAIPGEGDRADPEVFGQRQVERAIVAQRGGRFRWNVGFRVGPAQHLVEKLIL